MPSPASKDSSPNYSKPESWVCGDLQLECRTFDLVAAPAHRGISDVSAELRRELAKFYDRGVELVYFDRCLGIVNDHRRRDLDGSWIARRRLLRRLSFLGISSVHYGRGDIAPAHHSADETRSAGCLACSYR